MRETIAATLKGLKNGGSLSEYLFTLIHNDAKKVALVFRALPGAGKSYITDRLIAMLATVKKTARVSSADAFFTKNGAKYSETFNVGKLGEAHAESRETWRDSIRSGAPLIICDNTNVSPEEFAWYAHEANDGGYLVIFVNIEAPLGLCMERNIHIPKDRAERILTMMNERMRAVTFQPFPPFDLVATIQAGQ